jgi:hypothetical protein
MTSCRRGAATLAVCLVLAAGVAAQVPAPDSTRPNVVERPWTTSIDGPYGRAQAVAAERVLPETQAVQGSSPYPDQFRSPVPAPFRYEPSTGQWSGGFLFPALPFPAIGVGIGRSRTVAMRPPRF